MIILENKKENDKNNCVPEFQPANQTNDVDEAMELAGHGRYNYLLLAACSIISNASGLDMFGFSVVVAAASCDLELGLRMTGVLASVPFAGILFALPWGYYADTCGRRKALLLSTAVGFTMAALSSFSPNWQVMMALKLIGSCFSAASFTLTMTYLGESTGSRYRSQYLFIMSSVNLVAEAMFYALAYFILPLSFKASIPWLGITYRSWRLYTLILAVPLGIGALVILLLQESPKFLANQGESDKALKVLKIIYETNGGKKDEFPVKALKTQAVEETSSKSFWSSIAKQTVPLFKPPLLWRTIQLFYLMALCCSTNNIFVMWYPMIINLFFNSFSNTDDSLAVDTSFCQRVVNNITVDSTPANYICNDTISTNTIYSGIFLGLLLATFNLVASTVASWRQLVLMSLYTISAVSLVLVNLVRDPIVNIIVFTLVQVTSVGIGCVASYFVDLYPTSYSGLVTSLGMMVGRLVSLGGVNVVGIVIVNHCTMTFYICSAIVCSGIVVALFLPSDRKTK